MKLPLDKTFKILLIEAFIHRKFVIAMFLTTLIAGIALGLYWPKFFTSSATILVEDRNVMQPLLQNQSAPRGIGADRARLAAELMHSRKILGPVAEYAGLVTDKTPPIEREKIVEGLKKGMEITNVASSPTGAGGLIRVEYKDTDPERAFKVTKRAVELFLAENASTKARDSESSFAFLDAQVREYQAKVQKSEDALKKFRSGAFIPRNSGGNQPSREQDLEARVEQTMLELKEAEMRRNSLQSQLGGPVSSGADVTRLRQLQARVQELQQQLTTLRLTYHDTYPDVVRARDDLEQTKRQLAEEEKRNPAGAMAMDEASAGRLRQELATLNANIAALRTRLSESRRLLDGEAQQRGRTYNGATLSDLMRDYEVSQAALDELLKRREAARVSMTMDRERQGFSFAVHDEASLPLRPTGPAFIHFAIGGFLLGLLLPFGLLYAKQQLDSRVREPSLISNGLNLPVISVVPHLPTPAEAAASSRSLQWVGIFVFTLVFVVVSIIVSGGL